MEIAQAFSWISTTMKADTTLMANATGGVWQGFADIGTIAPYALVTCQSDVDVLTMNAVRLFTNGVFQIKAIGPTSGFTTLITIADRIDALFRRTGPVAITGGGGVLACYREQSVSYSEIINGSAWSHLGGLYRIALQAS